MLLWSFWFDCNVIVGSHWSDCNVVACSVAESALRLQVGLALGLVVLLGLVAALITYLYKKR